MAGDVAKASLAAGFVEEGGLTPTTDVTSHLNILLGLLSDAAGLPRESDGAPNRILSVIQLGHRPLGVGGRRGLQRIGGMDVAELRGGWLEAQVRFDFSGSDLNSIRQQAAAVQAALLASSLRLRQNRVLGLKLVGSSEIAVGTSPSSWLKLLDYKVLYEYQFQDTDGAASLIARIPIDSETDQGSLSHETTVIQDWMVRWDDQAALPLEIMPLPHRSMNVFSLSIAAHLPGGGPAGQVKQTVIRDGQTNEVQFNSLALFQDQFQLDSSPLNLVFPPLPLAAGEIQELREYRVGRLQFEPPIILKGGGDLFRISFSESTFPTNNQSVVYLRAQVS